MERKVEDLYVGEDFHARGEYTEGILFLHCDVYTKNLKTFKKIKKALQEVLTEARKQGYEKPLFSYVELGPKAKLSRMMGGVLCNTFEADGKQYEVYKWD